MISDSEWLNEPVTQSHGYRNEVLLALPEEELRRIQPYLVSVSLVSGQVLIEASQVSEHIFFMQSGIASLKTKADDLRPQIQVAMIGLEGVVGCQALLASDEPVSVATVVQIRGTAYRMPVAAFETILPTCPTLKELCLRAIGSLLCQVMQTAACNARDSLAERSVRWLLMVHDRVEGDELYVTHESLSTMLGARRSGITLVAAELQEAGLIRVSRGRITIVDRAGLEQRAKGRPWSAATH